MEDLLLWIDELDDLVFVALSRAGALRRLALHCGLTISLGLAAAEQMLPGHAGLHTPLAGAAAACLGIWAAVAAGGKIAAARAERPRLA
jgi:hypothetical protein